MPQSHMRRRAQGNVRGRRIAEILTLICLFLVFNTPFSAEAGSDEATDSQIERIAIVSAFGPEIAKLRSAGRVETEVVINGRRFILCEIANRKTVLFLSGVSMVNAAMTTQLALDHFNISHILFSGIAGGVNPDLQIGDVTIPSKWAQYQESVFARKISNGYHLGTRSRICPGYGMMFPQKVKVTHGRLRTIDGREEKFWFEVDRELLAIAEMISGMPLQPPVFASESGRAPRVVVGGNGVSGAAFVDNAAYRECAYRSFQADCLDMETAAVAHVAYVADVPFIAFRSLSDLAGGGAGENEMNSFYHMAADNAARVLLRFLAAWDESK